MPDLSAHEKFMLGEPLNEDLKAIRTGTEVKPASKPQPAERRSIDELDRELTRVERLDLKEFWEMPGQKLYLRIAEKSINFHQKRAISLSCDDPLNRRDEIANAWAYVKVLRRVVVELQATVMLELAELENEQ
jgi:hypothetical protein